MRFVHCGGKGHELRRPRARRRVQQRCGGHSRPHREGVARHAGPPQGVHPRRSPHALESGRGCTAEDAGRAASARGVRAGHHRPTKDERHHSLAHPALAVPSVACRHAGRTRAVGCSRRRLRLVARGDRVCARARWRFCPRHAVRAGTHRIHRRRSRRRRQSRRVHCGDDRSRRRSCTHRHGARGHARARPAHRHRRTGAAPS